MNNYSIMPNLQETKRFNRKMKNVAEKIRKDQAWVNEEKNLEDFNGDKDALLQFKINQGVRTLTQHEKETMFGLVNLQLQDTVDELKQMVGMEKKKKGGKKSIK